MLYAVIAPVSKPDVHNPLHMVCSVEFFIPSLTSHLCFAVQDTMYEMYPRIDEMKCIVHKIDDDDDSLSGTSAPHNRKLLQVKAPQLGFVSTILT